MQREALEIRSSPRGFVESQRRSDLVEDLNVVVRQVEENQTAEAAESPLLHAADVAALHGQVSQVRGVSEGPRGQLLDVVAPEIELDSDLRAEDGALEEGRDRGGSCAAVRTGR